MKTNDMLREALQYLYEMTSRYAISDSDYGIVCNAAAALAITAAPERSGKLADERAATQPAGVVPASSIKNARAELPTEAVRVFMYSPEGKKMLDDAAAMVRVDVAELDKHRSVSVDQLNTPMGITEADSSSAAPSEICECDGDSHKEECPVMVARNWPDLDRVAAPAPTGESAAPSDGYQHGSHSAEHIAAILGRPDLIASVAALKHKLWCAEVNLDGAKEEIAELRLTTPSPTGESLSEKPCVGCNGAGVIGTPGMPCPFCPVEKKLREFEAALVTPRQTSDPAAEDERLSKRIGATKGALASALRRPCVVKLEPGSSPSPFDPVFTTVTLDAEIPPPHQTEDGSRLSAAIDRGADGDWLWSRFMTLCKKHGVNEGGPLGNDLFGIVSDLRGLAPKETAAQGGVPEAEPVAWIRKTDITELTDSEPETNGWTPLYAAPTGSSK